MKTALLVLVTFAVYIYEQVCLYTQILNFSLQNILKFYLFIYFTDLMVILRLFLLNPLMLEIVLGVIQSLQFLWRCSRPYWGHGLSGLILNVEVDDP